MKVVEWLFSLEEFRLTYEPRSDHVALLQKVLELAINANNQQLIIICISYLMKIAPDAQVSNVTLKIRQLETLFCQKIDVSNN